ncbi:GntR family transcriptional regulator [Nguyenibacter vanlangensis]|uniref:GntR family transcriptional regulator n=1 Tax=Nguyenibacter vanlangensis TaxID=1216886 RepID=A0ABZ3D5D3_9PROT
MPTSPRAFAASLDSASPDPLYLQVAADIGRHIGHDPRFLHRLPSEAELCALYDVSRITIRQALAHLAERGLVVRRHGRGTFVSAVRRDGRQSAIYSFGDILAGQGLAPETELLAFGMTAPPAEVRAALGLGDTALGLRRGFSVNGRRVAVTEVHYPPALAERITEDMARETSSAEILTRRLGLAIDHADVSVDLAAIGPAVADWLRLPPASTLMRIRRVTHCTGLGPCEHSQILLSTGAAAFRVDAEGRIAPALGAA